MKTNSMSKHNKLVEQTIRLLRGRRIVDIRVMSKDELDENGWDDFVPMPMVIQLDDGTLLYPSCDGEGNGPGVLFFKMFAGSDSASGRLQLWSAP